MPAESERIESDTAPIAWPPRNVTNTEFVTNRYGIEPTFINIIKALDEMHESMAAIQTALCAIEYDITLLERKVLELARSNR